MGKHKKKGGEHLFWLVIVGVVLFLFFTVQGVNKHIQVDIENGAIIGETLEIEHSRNIHRFLGIPYAEPPIGSLRFKKTQPLERKWTEPLVATNWPVKCIQDIDNPSIAHDSPYEYNHEVSEDCLRLNVWTPAIETDETKLRPVIMWIHGGGLFMGTSSFEFYDSKTLSNMADAVVVTINYRLSTLGFFYSDKVDDIKGNQGLWDQTMALKWIQKNIRHFGGDPNKVTIAGESAGGWSVSALVLSPVSRNLFHNALMMSGAVDHRVVAKPEEVVASYLKGIRKAGCATEQDKSITEKVMNCINKLEPRKIDKIYHLMNEGTLMLAPVLTIDGEFFTDDPYEMLKKGDYKTDVNLIIDTVENEGSAMLSAMDQFKIDNPSPITLEQAKLFIGKLFNDQLLIDKEKIDTEKLDKLYFNGLNPLDDEDLFRNRASIAFGDFLLNCPTNNFARAVKFHAGNKASVFQLFYRLHTGTPKYCCSKWSGACHTDNFFSLFGLPYQNPEKYVDRERDAASEYISFMTDFIRTGKPNTRKPQWEEYFLLDDQTVVAPYFELTNEVTTHENYKFNLKHNECKLFSKYM